VEKPIGMRLKVIHLAGFKTRILQTQSMHHLTWNVASLACRLRFKCDGISIETRFRLSAKRTSPFNLAGASVQSTTGSRGVRISGSNAGYTKFRGSVKGTGYPLHPPVSPSLPLPCATVCLYISTGLYIHILKCIVEEINCKYRVYSLIICLKRWLTLDTEVRLLNKDVAHPVSTVLPIMC